MSRQGVYDAPDAPAEVLAREVSAPRPLRHLALAHRAELLVAVAGDDDHHRRDHHGGGGGGAGEGFVCSMKSSDVRTPPLRLELPQLLHVTVLSVSDVALLFASSSCSSSCASSSSVGSLALTCVGDSAGILHYFLSSRDTLMCTGELNVMTGQHHDGHHHNGDDAHDGHDGDGAGESREHREHSAVVARRGHRDEADVGGGLDGRGRHLRSAASALPLGRRRLPHRHGQHAARCLPSS